MTQRPQLTQRPQMTQRPPNDPNDSNDPNVPCDPNYPNDPNDRNDLNDPNYLNYFCPELLGFWTGSFSTLGNSWILDRVIFHTWSDRSVEFATLFLRLTCLLVRVWSQLSPPSPLVITDQLISWSHLAFPRLNRRRNVIGGRGVTFTQEKFLHFKILKN